MDIINNIENQIFINYSYIFLIIGGMLFLRAIYNLTEPKDNQINYKQIINIIKGLSH